MALNSSVVAAGDVTLATQYNNLRADVLYGAGDTVDATGGPNTYVVTADASIVAYVDGMLIKVRFDVNNTGASTVNINSIGAKSLVKTNGAGVTTAELLADTFYILQFNATLDAFQVVTALPPASAGVRTFSSPVYNNDGSLAQALINGSTHTFTYDNSGNLTVLNDGAITETMTYDSDNNLLTITFA